MCIFRNCVYCSHPINSGILCERCRDIEYDRIRGSFEGDLLDLLPQDWVREFGAIEVVHEFPLEEFVYKAYSITPKENIQSIAKLCIIKSHLDYPGGEPYEILYMLCNMGFKFNGELYELARSNECMDSERILELFCGLPVTRIQRVWRRYQQKRNRAIQIILPKVQEWLYRPGGLMMKKFEKHFNELATTQY
jgi:hypothetical protein